MKRREFLQQTGLALATLGLYETGLGCLSQRYFQALAQPSPRKLALLIGINQYSSIDEIRVPALQGCLTDVALQRELLVHRFGFQPTDILTLTDKAATREAIETAFLTHLTQQAERGDTVVVHFSGYGSQIQTDSSLDIWQNALMPVDNILSTDAGLMSNGLLEETLLLLLRSLRTDRVITTLDTSYITSQEIDTAPLGNLRVRSRPRLSPMPLNPDVLAFQEQLRTQSQPKPFGNPSRPIPGIILSASHGEQLRKASEQLTTTAPPSSALEASWSGFSAGMFTYALTRHLWTATAPTPWRVSLHQAATDIQERVGLAQQPKLSRQKSGSLRLEDLFSTINAEADGVVIGVEEEGRVARIWLAGLPAIVLEQFGANSLLTLVPTTTLEPETPASDTVMSARPSWPQLQVSGRDGLIAKARLSSSGQLAPSGQPNESEPPSLQVGQLVREAGRVVPRNLGLTIALDPNLERIERVDATSAFATIPHVKAIIATPDQPADCVFGRVINPVQIATALASTEASGDSESLTVRVGDLAPPSRYGLFSMNRELIASTGDEKVEAIKLAVQRLVPQTRSLLTAKLLHLITNENRSALKVTAVLKTIAPIPSLAQRSTQRTDPTQFDSDQAAISVPVGSRMSCQITNQGDRSLHLLLVNLDSLSNLLLLTPSQLTPNQAAPNAEGSEIPLISAIIAPRESPTLPQPATTFEWSIREPIGTTTTQVIASHSPFTQTLIALKNSSSRTTQELTTPTNPLEVVSALLQDLHQASGGPSSANATGETYTLNVATWATLSFVYQVV